MDRIDRLEQIVESLAKSVASLSDTVAKNTDEIKREQTLTFDVQRQMIDLLRELNKTNLRIDDLRADTKELMFENQRILRKLESIS